MSEKKYYWLKMQKDFYKRHDIKYIEKLPNGVQYVWFYVKLLLESIDHEGRLRFSELIPYDDLKLATITDTNIDIVRGAMNVFIELGMVTLLDDRTIFMEQVNRMIGNETSSAERQRRSRALKEERILMIEGKEEQKEEPKEEPKNQDKPSKHKYGQFKNVLLTDEEYKALKQIKPDTADNIIQYLDSYIEEKGYKAKSHYLTIRRWVIDAYNKNNPSARINEPIPEYKNDASDSKPSEEEIEKLKERLRNLKLTK